MKVVKKDIPKVYDSESSEYSDLEDEEDTDSDSSGSGSESGCDDDQGTSSEKETNSLTSEIQNNSLNSNNAVYDKTEKQIDEYECDTSDEEDIRNTVGNIPMRWYKDFPHIGYTVDGQKLMKPLSKDEIDEFLSKMDDPNYWRTVTNRMTGEKVVLTDEDVEMIKRLQSGKYATDVKFEQFEDFFTYETMEHPICHQPPHKRSFIPSKIEDAMVAKFVYSIKMGWMKPRAPKKADDQFYMIWDKESPEESKRLQNYIPAPKRKLPGHSESYNPPPEYLFTKEEEEKWNNQEPDERKIDFVPQKYSALRHIPSYPTYIKEWFERCLDLYLCPRQRKMRANIDPNDLLPQLPKPKDLHPFPTSLALVYTGHTGLVRSISMEITGQFLASGSDDHTVRIWEVLTGRCLRIIDVGGPVQCVAWGPSEALSLLLVAVEEKILIINARVGDKVVISNTDAILEAKPENPDNKVITWEAATEEQKKSGISLVISHSKKIKQIVWHTKSDYFAVLTSEVDRRCILIHQLSKMRSQIPFQKIKGKVQCVLFHPLRPVLFLATQTHVKVCNLLKQEITKLYRGHCKWISSMAVHPQGDNVIIGSYDAKLSWLDLELSSKPYKTFRHHSEAIRQVCFHKRYPLFASTSDDGSMIVCHGMVYSDLLQNPLIVPVKVLKGQGVSLDCCFHPLRPWVLCSSNDTIRLYS